jgi:hypothetical protein
MRIKVEFVTLIISPYGSYSYKDASNIEMNILGNFLSSDVGFRITGFKDWFYDDLCNAASSNATYLYKEDDFIFVGDLYPVQKYSAELKISRQQFIKLLDKWEEKVCKEKPKEVTITEKDGEFSIETKD